ncbi:MAG: DoxX family protein [Gemmataceae bacterium]|nr:DoxX family protein [Gemmataceae bacterium]
MIEWPKLVGWVLSLLLGLVFLMSAMTKFFAPGMVAEQMPAGIAPWLTIIGLGELASALLFLVPLTAPLGTLLLSSYMGGAIIVHMTRQGDKPEESFIPQAVILVLIWIAGLLRGTWGWGQRRP